MEGAFWYVTFFAFQELLNLSKTVNEEVESSEGYTTRDVVENELRVEKPEVCWLCICKFNS